MGSSDLMPHFFEVKHVGIYRRVYTVFCSGEVFTPIRDENFSAISHTNFSAACDRGLKVLKEALDEE